MAKNGSSSSNNSLDRCVHQQAAKASKQAVLLFPNTLSYSWLGVEGAVYSCLRYSFLEMPSTHTLVHEACLLVNSEFTPAVNRGLEKHWLFMFLPSRLLSFLAIY